MFEHYQMTEKDHTAKILKITHNTTTVTTFGFHINWSVSSRSEWIHHKFVKVRIFHNCWHVLQASLEQMPFLSPN